MENVYKEAIEEIFEKALEQWKTYDNEVCNEIQQLVGVSEFKGNSNFYEFVKGYTFSHIYQRNKK